MKPDPQQYILMIEDDADDRYITETVFIENGYPIRLEFLLHDVEVIDHLANYADEHLPALIILDKNLPKTNGFELLSRLKAHNRYKYIPIIIVSGSASEKEIVESYLLGANSFIQKPLTNHVTTERIKSFVQYWFEVVDLPYRKSRIESEYLGI